MKYPSAERSETTDTYPGGVIVQDPYRWLEDADSEATRRWIHEQNLLTQAYLAEGAARDRLRSRLTELWNYERFGVPLKEGGRYFFTRNDGLQNQSVLYTMDHVSDSPRVLIDPNTFSPDGTVALTGVDVSRDGKRIAYGTAGGGSDWQDWHVRDVDTGEDLPDLIRWIKFSAAVWSADGKGLFYSRFAEPRPGEALQGVNYFHKLYYHQLGTTQDEDTLVYERPDRKEWGFNAVVTEDARFLIISVFVGTDHREMVFYKELPNGPIVELLPYFDASYRFVGNNGNAFWFRTDRDAPRGRLIEIRIDQPDRVHWREIIPETSDTLDSVSCVGEAFIATYLKDAHSLVKVHALDGRVERTVDLPGFGTVSGFCGKRNDAETFYQFTGFANPGTVFRYNVTTGHSEVFRKAELRFDPSNYETTQVFYQSKDGTRVPMFIARRRGVGQDGPAPTELYGYGGFNIPITPFFNIPNLVWMDSGGILAVANIRGGSEYGEDWHQAGIRGKKQNVFDDFIAAAEFLIAEGYTLPSKLAISGGSNGGLLVGACLSQRPELFGAAVAHVAVMDMLRFHKFTIGWAWVSDYGSPDNPEDFPALYAYSPYHNLKPGTAYPATLLVTGDHDDRVVPAHSFKFAAALQHAQGGTRPVLIRIETRAGHGAGKPTSKQIDEAADVLSFLMRELEPVGER